MLLVERERLAQEYLDLRQGTETVMEITKTFTEISIFCLEFATSKKVQMTHYLSMLEKKIH